MKTLNQILKNAVVYAGLLAALNLSCGDGSDSSGNPNPNGNSADAGYSNEGGEGSEGGEGEGGYLPPPRKDAGVNYNDANEGGEGEDVSEGGEGGQEGVPPVVIIETKDEQGNVTDTFKRGEIVVYDVNKSHDPDCQEAGTCGTSKGMDYCDWWDEFGNAGKIYFPDFGKGVSKISYGSPKDMFTATVKCYDLDDKLSSIAQIIVHLTD